MQTNPQGQKADQWLPWNEHWEWEQQGQEGETTQRRVGRFGGCVCYLGCSDSFIGGYVCQTFLSGKTCTLNHATIIPP